MERNKPYCPLCIQKATACEKCNRGNKFKYSRELSKNWGEIDESVEDKFSRLAQFLNQFRLINEDDAGRVGVLAVIVEHEEKATKRVLKDYDFYIIDIDGIEDKLVDVYLDECLTENKDSRPLKTRCDDCSILIHK